ncbi:uncharacterized protein LOC119068073 [Bradysia coprophila]|uniref:uncharacterized protein LOC119068073 n=1 Tax=Bradysia coprophila TaxID=38358 RepID=UPI00187D89ED|nr:uncharacterized protein LOC119068073 [Bradysia coprophila]
MRCLIVILCLLQFRVQAFDWLDRTIRVDLIVDRTRRDFDPRYDSIKQQSETMLISATNATNGQYPWSIFTTAWIDTEVGLREAILCSGTIISENFALSDISCTGQDQNPPASSIELYVGLAQWPLTTPTNFVRHFWYIEPSPENSPSIVLYRLHESLIFNPNVHPIRLPFYQNFYYEGWSSLVLGYGSLSSETYAAQLQSVHTSITNNSLCNVAIDEHEICGIESREPNETDAGFSGGAWIVYEYTDAGLEFIPVLIGIHQSSNNTTSFGRATRVSHFSEWIETLTTEA